MVCVGLRLGYRWVSFGLFTDAFLLAFLQASELHFLDGLPFCRCDNLQTISYSGLAIDGAQEHHLRVLRSRFLQAHFRVDPGLLSSRLSLRRYPLAFLCVRIF